MRFLLIHGAWHGGWCWRHVVSRLERDGHEAVAPTLPGLGERATELSPELSLDDMIDDVVGLMRRKDLAEVVLVGHSFSGAVITGVADRVPERLRALVYLDAVIVGSGGDGFRSISRGGAGGEDRRGAGARWRHQHARPRSERLWPFFARARGVGRVPR